MFACRYRNCIMFGMHVETIHKKKKVNKSSSKNVKSSQTKPNQIKTKEAGRKKRVFYGNQLDYMHCKHIFDNCANEYFISECAHIENSIGITRIVRLFFFFSNKYHCNVQIGIEDDINIQFILFTD